MTFTLAPVIAPPIRRVLDASFLDGRDAVGWLMNPKTETIRKACLLNMLAKLSVTPTKETPLIADVIAVFAVKLERIYAVLRAEVRARLETYVADDRMPFYRDSGPVLAVHHELLAHLPAGIAAPGFQAAGPLQTPLASFRAEGAPSLQLVIADSPYAYTVADVDLDEHNPLEDVVGLVGHLLELSRGGVTDQIAMRETLSHGAAAPFLCYTLT